LQGLPGCWTVSNVPLAEVDIGLLADQVGVTATDTLDLGQSVHDLLLAVNVGVEQTQNELEVRLLAGHERCNRKKSNKLALHFPDQLQQHWCFVLLEAKGIR
jgi:hypothetical protein